MFKIIGTEIYLTRGDTANIAVSIIDPNTKEEYELQAGDLIKFSMKENIADTTFVLQKTFTNKAIKILPADTDSLDFGEYLYDIELTFANGDVNTIIPPSLFKIENEIS
jgi:hypothetical protein